LLVPPKLANTKLQEFTKYGYVQSKERCPHWAVAFSQTGIPGVVTMMRKWWKICRKDLGKAHLKESLLGNRWE
jgi:hypothetical protein